MSDARNPEFTPEQLAEVRRLQGLYPDKRGALLPVLHLAQDTFGYISLEIEEYVAGLFELYPAHVHEVVTFYTLFFQKPKGRHVVFVCHNISCYLMNSKGIIQHVEERLRMEPAAITEEVKKANLRGLGGAAFPTGVKWGFIPKASTAPRYLVINADEGEPGTFKDRYLMERDPHALIEGMVIAARAIGSQLGFVYIRGEYVQPWRVLDGAVREAYAAGLLGKNIQGSGTDFDVVLHRGAGAYICGEETGLLSSLEGKKGWPKIKPPFPAVKGAFGHPTIVNNVETIMAVPHIINRGAEWFAGLGTKSQGGTRLYSVSGHVERPGVIEAPVSVTLRQLIYDHCGGIRGGKQLKAVVPGGSSAAILTPDEIDIQMDVDGPKSKGSMIGSAGIIVMDETVSIPEALMVVARFYAHESCGQCTPCR